MIFQGQAPVAVMTGETPQAGMALGGLGRGVMEIWPDGTFRHPTMFGRQVGGGGRRFFAKGPVEDLFCLARVEEARGRVRMRRLMLGQMFAQDPRGRDKSLCALGCLPEVEAIRFASETPRARLDFLDTQLPVEMSLEAWSPLVPHDGEASRWPGMFLDFSVKNRSRETVRVEVAVALGPSVGLGEEARWVGAEEGEERMVVAARDGGGGAGWWALGWRRGRNQVGRARGKGTELAELHDRWVREGGSVFGDGSLAEREEEPVWMVLEGPIGAGEVSGLGFWLAWGGSAEEVREVEGRLRSGREELLRRSVRLSEAALNGGMDRRFSHLLVDALAAPLRVMRLGEEGLARPMRGAGAHGLALLFPEEAAEALREVEPEVGVAEAGEKEREVRRASRWLVAVNGLWQGRGDRRWLEGMMPGVERVFSALEREEGEGACGTLVWRAAMGRAVRRLAAAWQDDGLGARAEAVYGAAMAGLEAGSAGRSFYGVGGGEVVDAGALEGELFAVLTGLPRALDRDKVRTTLRLILEQNVDGELGLLRDVHPLAWPVPVSEKAFTCAALCFLEGMEEEGLRLLGQVFERLSADGLRFGLPLGSEAGAEALAVWAAQAAWLGLVQDRVAGVLQLTPRMEGRRVVSPFLTCAHVGTVEIDRRHGAFVLELEIAAGVSEVKVLVLSSRVRTPRVERNGEAVAFDRDEGVREAAVLRLERPVLLEPGTRLRVV